MPSQLASDSFTDTDGVLLRNHTADDGGTWTKHPSSTSDAFLFINNRIYHPSGSTWEALYHSAVPDSADYEVSYVAYMYNNTGHMCVAARIDPSAANFYYAGQVDGNAFDVGKCVGGVFTQLGSGSTTIGSGQTHVAKLTAHGSFLAVHGNRLVMATVIDSDITAAGHAGVFTNTFQGTTSGVHMESWAATEPEALDNRAHTENNGSGTTATGNRPSGTQDGDLLIAEVRTLSSIATVTVVPSGWTLAGQATVSSSGGFIRTYYKIASSEPASWNWTILSTSWQVIVHAYYDGADAHLDSVINKSEGWGTNAAYSLPSVDAPRDNTLVHGSWAPSSAPAVYPTDGVSPTDLVVTKNTPPSPWIWVGWLRRDLADGSTSLSMNRGGAASGGAGQLLIFVPSTSEGAPIFIDQTSAFVSSRTATCNVPAATQDGDLMIACLAVDRQTETITDPSGWTLIGSDNKNGGIQRFYYREASSEPASYTWASDPASSFMSIIMRTYRGAAVVSPIDGTVASNTGASITATAPTLTTTEDNTRLLVFATQGGTRTIPSSSLGNVATAGSTLHGGDAVKGAAGVTPAHTLTLNSTATWYTWAFAVKAAPPANPSQVVRATADDTIGGWVNESGGTTNLYISINEETASALEYVESGVDPSNDTVRFKIDPSLADPNVSDGYIFDYWIGKSGAGSIDLTVRIVQGAATEIASWTHMDVAAGPTPVTQTLTGTQADLITDHMDLYMEFMANTP